MATIQGRSPSTGRAIDVAVNAAGSVIIGSDALAVDTRIATYNAAADCAGNLAAVVTADLWKVTTFTTTARRIVAEWHEGSTTYAGTAGAGPIAVGAMLTINADDDAAAATRLTTADVTGNSTSSSGKADKFVLSRDNPVIDITTDAAITRIDAIGIAAGVTPTSIIASRLVIKVLG